MKCAGRGLLAACLTFAWAGVALAQPAPKEEASSSTGKTEHLKDLVFPSRGVYTFHMARVLEDDGGNNVTIQAEKCTFGNDKPYTVPLVLSISGASIRDGIQVYTTDNRSAQVKDFKSVLEMIRSSTASARLRGNSLKNYLFWWMDITANVPSPSGSGFTCGLLTLHVPQRTPTRACASSSPHEDFEDRDAKDSGLLAPNRTYILDQAKVVKGSKDFLTLEAASVGYTTDKNQTTPTQTGIKTVLLPLVIGDQKQSDLYLGASATKKLRDYDDLLAEVKKEGGWNAGSLEGYVFPRIVFTTLANSDKEVVVPDQTFDVAGSSKVVESILQVRTTYLLRDAKVVAYSKDSILLVSAGALSTPWKKNEFTKSDVQVVRLHAKNVIGRPVPTTLKDADSTSVDDFEGLLKVLEDRHKLTNSTLVGFSFPEVEITTLIGGYEGRAVIGIQTLKLTPSEAKAK